MTEPALPKKRPKKPRAVSLMRQMRPELFDPRASLKRWLRELKAGVPGLGVSLGMHLVLLLALALFVVSTRKVTPPPVLSGRWVTDAEVAAAEKNKQPIVLDVPEMPEEAPPTRKVEPKKVEEPEILSSRPSEVGVSHALAARSPGARKDQLETLGATEETEKAVKRGLDWFKRFQQPDGRWQLAKIRKGRDEQDPGYPNAADVKLRTDTGATALALLAFLGAGHTHQEGEYQPTVKKGLDYLVKNQRDNGDLFDGETLGLNQAFYAHGQGAIALCEVYAMTHDEALREPAQKSLNFIYESQHPEKGGWKYQPQSPGGDLSVFGWQIMAIQSGRMAGLDVPPEVLDRSLVFLDSVQSDEGARYKYEPDRPVSASMTAEGLLCRQYLGWPRNHPALKKGAAFIAQDDLLPNWSNGKRNVYFWYYATQTLHNMQGPEWKSWNAALQKALVESQVKSGRQMGSWYPAQVVGDPLEHSEVGGRFYVTAMCLLTLEVYYRHLPLYQPEAAASDAPSP